MVYVTQISQERSGWCLITVPNSNGFNHLKADVTSRFNNSNCESTSEVQIRSDLCGRYRDQVLSSSNTSRPKKLLVVSMVDK